LDTHEYGVCQSKFREFFRAVAARDFGDMGEAGWRSSTMAAAMMSGSGNFTLQERLAGARRICSKKIRA
jgi:hypothetical protein